VISSNEFSSAIQDACQQYNVPELVRANLVRRSVALEGKLGQKQREIELRDAEIERLRAERDEEHKARVALELQLQDIRKHSNSLSGMLERIQAEREARGETV
jgi:hypothetical protein